MTGEGEMLQPLGRHALCHGRSKVKWGAEAQMRLSCMF